MGGRCVERHVVPREADAGGLLALARCGAPPRTRGRGGRSRNLGVGDHRLRPPLHLGQAGREYHEERWHGWATDCHRAERILHAIPKRDEYLLFYRDASGLVSQGTWKLAVLLLGGGAEDEQNVVEPARSAKHVQPAAYGERSRHVSSSPGAEGLWSRG